ncbi:MAG: sigma 54-interacting transcriptional regulator [Polyangiaceae bacterium]
MTFSKTETTSTDADDDGDALSHQLALVLAFECQRPRAGGLRVPLGANALLSVGRGAERSLSGDSSHLELRVPDAKLSKIHAEVKRRGDKLLARDVGSTNGTYVNQVRCADWVTLEDGDVLRVGHTFFVAQCRPMISSSANLVDPKDLEGFATLEPSLAAGLERLERIAGTPLPVMLLGESGTGKELLARAIHQRSRRSGPFVAVNCGALTPTLIESQLFGHVRGAFSGAVRDQPGLIRTAHQGTLFLDEVAELRPEAQATLLRVLQEGEVLPVGGTQATRVDLRVVSATLRPINPTDADGRFRRDLYARLAGFVFSLPPLREHIEDLGVITAQLLERSPVTSNRNVSLRPAAADLLLRYDWPLNVRELQQVLAAASALTPDGVVRPSHLPELLRPTEALEAAKRAVLVSELSSADQSFRADLIRELRAHGGNITAAARSMGKARQQVQRWIRRLAIDPEHLDEQP